MPASGYRVFVAAGANVHQFGRFETADGFGWLRTLRDGNDDVNPGLRQTST